MLGDDADVVGGQAVAVERFSERPRGRERAEAGGRDARVQAVGERARVGEHAADRQAERERDVASRHELRAAALGFDEAGAAGVVRAAGLVRREAHRLEVFARRRRAHVREADHALGREVVEAAREHGQRLPGDDLVVRDLE